MIINKTKKRRTCQIVDFAVSADQRVKIKDKYRDKYLDLERELKTIEYEKHDNTNCNRRFWNGPQKFGKGLEELEIRGGIETIQTTAVLTSARILRRVLDTWKGLPSFKLQWKTLS